MVNTVTLYRSPVRLVEHASEDTGVYSSQAISRARKRLMAEISLLGDEIVIDDVPYSRNDASTLLDFITESNWKTHSIVYAQKGLLHFLEKEEFNNDELKKADAYLYNTSFVQAVSPYFAHSFNALSGRLIRQDSFVELVQLLHYQGYILPEHSHEAYQKIRTYLDDLNYSLRNLSWEKFAADESILHFVFSDEWKRFVNALPPAFTSARDELVEHMISIVLRFQHKATWHYLHQVLVQLKAIETNDFNRSEVERIDKVIYGNSQIEGGKRIKTDTGEISTGRIVWWIIWAVLIVIRVATCNDKSSKTDYGFANDPAEIQKYQQRSSEGRSTEQKNEKYLLRFLDSISQQKNIQLQSVNHAMRTGDQPFNSFANLPERYGPCDITITNNTLYNCVMVYFDGPAKQGSIYAGSLSNTVSVYIKKGESYSFKAEPSVGSLHFIFGEQWGNLAKQQEMPISNYNEYSSGQTVPIYEFFKPGKPLQQKYLKRGIRLEYPSENYDEKEYIYLNKPKRDNYTNSVELTLTEKNNSFSIAANGGLAVKEKKGGEFEEILQEFKKTNNGKEKQSAR